MDLRQADPRRAGVPVGPGRPRVDDGTRGTCCYDWHRFLGLLRFFQHFEEWEQAALVQDMEVIEVKPGCAVLEEGEPGRHCYIVLRGALESSTTRAGRKFPLAVIGPGEACGDIALLDGGVQPLTAMVREHATLLEISGERFEELLRSAERIALKFQLAVCENRVADLARANRVLAALIGQDSIQGNRTIGAMLDVQPAFGQAPGESAVLS